MEFKIKHKVLASETGEIAIELESEFPGVIFSYSDVKFDDVDLETAENVNLNFNYDILRGYTDDFDFERFEKTIGDLLLEILEFEIKRKNTSEILKENQDADN